MHANFVRGTHEILQISAEPEPSVLCQSKHKVSYLPESKAFRAGMRNKERFFWRFYPERAVPIFCPIHNGNSCRAAK